MAEKGNAETSKTRLHVQSREYKIMLDHRLFGDRKRALESLEADLAVLAKRERIETRGELDKSDEREVTFLDTPSQTIYLNELVFRRRVETKNDGDRKVRYTLKCRSLDRYRAAAALVAPTPHEKAEVKLEEDIGAPFQVRFSYSGSRPWKTESIATLGEAAEVFPALARLERDGAPCPLDVRLEPVGGLTFDERVVDGLEWRVGDEWAEAAVIFWSHGKDARPLVVEFSFRYRNDHEDYSGVTVRTAQRLFEGLQRLDWFAPDGRTKTQFAFQR